jgi:hypothetical protein
VLAWEQKPASKGSRATVNQPLGESATMAFQSFVADKSK